MLVCLGDGQNAKIENRHQSIGEFNSPSGRARGWLAPIFLYIDFEAFAISLELPVGNFVAHAEEERTAAKIDPSYEHAAEMAKMADIVSGGANGTEELDGSHDSHEGAHGNR